MAIDEKMVVPNEKIFVAERARTYSDDILRGKINKSVESETSAPWAWKLSAIVMFTRAV